MTPARAGTVWLAAEHEQLREEFAAGMDLQQMMAAHQRTAYAILGRLVQIGLLTADYRPILQDPWITPQMVNHIVKENKL